MTRHYGSGSVYYDKRRDRWVAQVMVDGRPVRVSLRTKAEARAKARELTSAKDHGRVITSAGTTGRWLQKWLDDVVPGTVAAATEDFYRHVVADWVLPHVGQVPLAKLAPEHVRHMMRALEQKGLSPRSRDAARKALGRALRQAEEDGLVSRNAARLVAAPKGANRPRTDDTMTADEALAVLEAAKGDRLEPLAGLVLSVGLRLSEALDLRWSDLDLDAGRALVVGTKTEASVRAVALPPFVVTALRAHRTRQLEERLASKMWAEPDLVFASVVGTRYDRWQGARWWQRLTVAAGLGPRRFHSSRHTAATLMLNNGVPLEVVSETLGHAGLAITKDVYAQVLPELQRQAADVMERVLGPA